MALLKGVHTNQSDTCLEKITNFLDKENLVISLDFSKQLILCHLGNYLCTCGRWGFLEELQNM